MFVYFKKCKELHKNFILIVFITTLIILSGCDKIMLKIKLVINNPSRERLVMRLKKGQIFTHLADGNYAMQNFCLSEDVYINIPAETSKSYVLNGFCTDARKRVPQGPAEMTRIKFGKKTFAFNFFI